MDFCNFSYSYLKENLSLVVSIRLLILMVLGCLENFSMHAKTRLIWVFLERCASSLCIFEFLTIELNKFWTVFATSIWLEMISSFSSNLFSPSILDWFFLLYNHFAWLVFCRDCKNRPLEVFCKKSVLKNFAISTGKHLCRSLFLINYMPLDLQLY